MQKINLAYLTNEKQKLVSEFLSKIESGFYLDSILYEFNHFSQSANAKNIYNFYFCHKDKDYSYLMVLTDALNHYFIIDRDILQESKEYMWRLKYVKNNNNVLCYRIGGEKGFITFQNTFFAENESSVCYFIGKNRFDLRKSNIKVLNYMNSQPVTEYKKLSLEESGYGRDISDQYISKQKLKEYELLKKSVGMKYCNYYYKMDEKTIILAISSVDDYVKNKKMYKILIDSNLYEKLSNQNWIPVKDSRKPEYLIYIRNTSQHSLHRIVYCLANNIYIHDLNFPIDHINRNTLDNRAENLRAVTNSENNRNMGIRKNNVSSYPGVRFNPQKKRWIAFRGISPNGRYGKTKLRTGKFLTFEEAVEYRKILEKIPEHEFLTDLTTPELIAKLKK